MKNCPKSLSKDGNFYAGGRPWPVRLLRNLEFNMACGDIFQKDGDYYLQLGERENDDHAPFYAPAKKGSRFSNFLIILPPSFPKNKKAGELPTSINCIFVTKISFIFCYKQICTTSGCYKAITVTGAKTKPSIEILFLSMQRFFYIILYFCYFYLVDV